MATRFGIVLAVLFGIAFCVTPLHNQASAETMKGESHDRKMTGSHGSGGGGGAGATQSKQKKKMLNPQPEPPGRR